MRALPLVAALLVVVAAGGCRRKSGGNVNLNAANQVAPRMVKLFYESPAMLLVGEPRNLQLPQSPAGAMSVVIRELIKGPVNPALPRLFPADTVVRGAFLLPDGTAFVDLGGGTLSQGWATGSHEELMAAYSIVQTVTTNFPEAKRVRVLMNGAPSETLAGHLALDKPLVVNTSLVDPRFR